VDPPLLAHYVKLDEQAIRMLLGERALDGRLAPFTRLINPEPAPLHQTASLATDGALVVLVRRARDAGMPLRVYLQGRGSRDRAAVMESLATSTGLPILAANVVAATRADPEMEEIPRVLCRDAFLHGAVLFLDGV